MGTVKYTGPVASFHCPTEATIRSLKVHFSPKQEGTGTPSPENVREIVGWDGVEVYHSGKNLFDASKLPATVNNYYTEQDGYIYVDHNYGLGWINQPTCLFLQPGTYTASLKKISGTANESAELRSAEGGWVWESWGVYSRPTKTYTDKRNMAIRITGEKNIVGLQVELGSTATSYESYHGSTTNYEFGVLGKNKFPVSDGATSDIFLAANTTYTISATSPSVGYFRGWYEDETDTGLIWINAGSDGDRRWKTFTPEKNIVKGVMYVGTGMSECQIELGSTATAYEPYDPNKTVYGGWVDLVSGEVCEEWRLITGNDLTTITAPTSTSSPWNHIFTIGLWNNMTGTWDKAKGASNIISDVAITGNSNVNQSVFGISNSAGMYLRDDSISTQEEFLEKYGDKHIAYEIATPISYSLAPTTLQTFLSTNNVWSNADYVEVEYDLHETQTILARKQFIIANQPHVVKPVTAPLQNFVTDMAAPLKECKVYFSPVQEGEGDPSPDNVRAITGWNKFTICRSGINLVDETFLSDFNNYITDGAYGYYYTDYIQLVPNTKYRFVWFDFDDSQMLNSHLYVDGAAEYIVWNGTHRQYLNGFTTNATGKIRFGINRGSYDTRQEALTAIFQSGKLLLQIGTDDISYEPYQGTTIPIDWSSAGTVYGGYVDLMTGEVWKTYNKIILDGDNIQVNNGSYESNGNYGAGLVYVEPTGEFARYKNGLPLNLWSENIPLYIGVNTLPELPYVYAPLAGKLYFVVYVAKVADHPELADKTARKNYVNEWLKQNPITLVYELETPTIVATLTPTQLKTLRGTNNIWSNANGNIELSYWKH